MTTQITMDDRQQGRSGLGINLAMTAISLAVVGVFVLWHAWPEGGQRSESSAEEVAVSAAAEKTMPRGEQEAAVRTITEWLYIVESEARAQSLLAPRMYLTDGDIDLWEPTSRSVVWFDSEEAEARFWQTNGEVDAVREHYGLPRLTVVDLRGPAQPAAPLVEVGPANDCGLTAHQRSC